METDRGALALLPLAARRRRWRLRGFGWPEARTECEKGPRESEDRVLLRAASSGKEGISMRGVAWCSLWCALLCLLPYLTTCEPDLLWPLHSSDSFPCGLDRCAFWESDSEAPAAQAGFHAVAVPFPLPQRFCYACCSLACWFGRRTCLYAFAFSLLSDSPTPTIYFYVVFCKSCGTVSRKISVHCIIVREGYKTLKLGLFGLTASFGEVWIIAQISTKCKIFQQNPSQAWTFRNAKGINWANPKLACNFKKSSLWFTSSRINLSCKLQSGVFLHVSD